MLRGHFTHLSIREVTWGELLPHGPFSRGRGGCWRIGLADVCGKHEIGNEAQVKGMMTMRGLKTIASVGAFLGCMLWSCVGNAGQVAIVNGGFESGPTYCNSSPHTYGVWSYDGAPVVTAENGIMPYEGSHMARFDNTLPCASGAEASELYQTLDISSIAADIATGSAMVWAEYYVNRIAGDAQTDSEFDIWIAAFSGSPANFNPTISNPAIRLKVVSSLILSDSNPQTWERVTVLLENIPVATTYLAVGIWARENMSPQFEPGARRAVRGRGAHIVWQHRNERVDVGFDQVALSLEATRRPLRFA